MVRARIIAFVLFFGTLFLLLTANAVGDTVLYHYYGRDGTISAAMATAPPIVIALFSFMLGGVCWGLIAHFWWSTPFKKGK